ncbi:MAG TPA: hypothetical protein VK554_04125, partial [Bradyrhizobium sp.]|nr:hypothetical protein [Bradyrhizobium sp.]
MHSEQMKELQRSLTEDSSSDRLCYPDGNSPNHPSPLTNSDLGFAHSANKRRVFAKREWLNSLFPLMDEC